MSRHAGADMTEGKQDKINLTTGFHKKNGWWGWPWQWNFHGVSPPSGSSHQLWAGQLPEWLIRQHYPHSADVSRADNIIRRPGPSSAPFICLSWWGAGFFWLWSHLYDPIVRHNCVIWSVFAGPYSCSHHWQPVSANQSSVSPPPSSLFHTSLPGPPLFPVTPILYFLLL